MAQVERTGSFAKHCKDGDIDHLHGEHHEVRWVTTPTTPTLGKDHDQEEDHHHHDQTKKSSILTKVKEKAKKWRHTLVNKKKHGHNNDNSSSTTTPAWGVSLEDDDNDNAEDPEYFGAPMYESELAPEGYKETVSQHPRTNTPSVVSDKHVMTTHITIPPPPKDQEKEIPATSKTITESVTEKLAPAYAKVSEATQLITSKIQNETIPTSLAPIRSDDISSTGEHQWDKGFSVKEYLMQKLEPGAEERALSEVISDAMSPKTITGDTGVVEKVREAVSSMLGIEQSMPSLPTTTENMMSSHIPLSTNAQEVIVEENQERRLQAN